MKYMGSKARIAKHILPIILKNRKPEQWYVEPFVGGANMIDKVDGNRMGNDINKYLIALLQHLSNGFIPEEISREKYNSIREFKSNFPDWLVGYAGVCCSYSGKWFGGFAGEVNTKGGVSNYQKEAIANIEKQSKNLKHIEASSMLFVDMLQNTKIQQFNFRKAENVNMYFNDFFYFLFNKIREFPFR